MTVIKMRKKVKLKSYTSTPIFHSLLLCYRLIFLCGRQIVPQSRSPRDSFEQKISSFNDVLNHDQLLKEYLVGEVDDVLPLGQIDGPNSEH